MEMEQENKEGVNQKMPTYKLTYFNFHSLAEPIRFIFTIADIEFEDFRFNYAMWPSIKPKTPFGQVPVLEYHGKKAHQTVAICRYLAKKAYLDGKDDDWANLQIDAIVDTITDLLIKIQSYYYEEDPVWKATRKEQLDDILPFYLTRLDAIVKNTGYFFENGLTWADIYFVGLLEYFDFMLKKDIVADWPHLKALKERIMGLERIQDYLEQRPAPMKQLK